MNRFFQSSLLVTGTLVLAVAAFAQQTAPAAPPATPRADAPAAPINPNQATPATEQAAAPAPLRELNFAEADTDGDKRISLSEFSTFVESRMASRSTETVREETIQRFLDLDQNNDAYLSESEARVTPQSTQPAAAKQPR